MDAIKTFLTGFASFQERMLCGEEALYATLKHEQRPSTLVVACCDSRTDPAMILGCSPGDIFVVRNVANMVPPFAPGQLGNSVAPALEFGVRVLKVAHIIVLGHSCCGGIKTLMENAPAPEIELLGAWMSQWAAVREEVLEQYGEVSEASCAACEQAGVRRSLEHLQGYPWIDRALREGRLDLHGWYFDMDAGELLAFDPETRSFKALVPPCSQD